MDNTYNDSRLVSPQRKDMYECYNKQIGSFHANWNGNAWYFLNGDRAGRFVEHWRTIHSNT